MMWHASSIWTGTGPRHATEGTAVGLKKPAKGPPDVRTADPLRIAEALYRQRRSLKLIAVDISSDPVLDMLLSLFISGARGRRESVSSICIASGVAPTTALRYLSGLVENGAVVRERDVADGRRVFVRLTTEVSSLLGSWLVETAAALTE